MIIRNLYCVKEPLDQQLEDIFRRVLNPVDELQPLPVVDPPAYALPQPQRQNNRRGRRREAEEPAVQQRPAGENARAERHLRRQALIDEVRNNREGINEIPPVANNPGPELQGMNPPVPNNPGLELQGEHPQHLCTVCSLNAINSILPCGHPFCLECLTIIRNKDRPNYSQCPRCRARFDVPTRIFF